MATSSRTDQPQFTEGPWSAEIRETDEALELTICNVAGDADEDGRLIDVGGSLLEGGILVLEDDATNRANARLMASGPDLYEALRRMSDFLADVLDNSVLTRESGGRAELLIRNAEATLAEARGDDRQARLLREIDL